VQYLEAHPETSDLWMFRVLLSNLAAHSRRITTDADLLYLSLPADYYLEPYFDRPDEVAVQVCFGAYN